jgi:uncharacterized membrane protein
MHFLPFDLPQFAQAYPAAALAIFGISGPIFWMYFAAVALFAIGLPIIFKNELRQAHGLDKIMPFGRLFFAIPLAVFSTEHFTLTRFIVILVPSWIPWHLFWVYLVGVALMAAALSITVKKHSELAATLLGIMFFLFVALMDIPGVAAHPRDRFAWALAFRELSFSGGAFAFAGAQMQARASAVGARLVTLARYFVAIAALFYSVEHFLHPECVPGVPLERLAPTWIPGHLILSYLAGAVLLGSGACLLINKKGRLAAAYLGIMVIVLVLAIYLPILAAKPSDVEGLNYFADTLMYSGAILLLANALPKENHPHD